VIHQVYAAAARYRRRFYASHPERRRRLAQPVISVGNLAVGGRGKTPLVAAIASRLTALGERPAILSRGYARQVGADGVVVVRDPDGIRADVDRAGDEPLMLAKQLDGVAVLTCSSRYLAGRLAEHHFKSTVHLLDDGFQHLQLHRDIDLVVIAREDIADPRTLPAGRLREPLESIDAADGIITLDEASVQALGRRRPAWRARRRLGAARLAEPFGSPVEFSFGSALAVAGIAEPGRFFADLRAAGWPIAQELSFGDHHAYSRTDLDRIVRTAHEQGARLIVTTEKDLVRLLPFRPFSMPIAYVPLVASIEPQPQFDQWLIESLRAAREARR
jgi:tetraacyldisaccharide 4'-kinase